MNRVSPHIARIHLAIGLACLPVSALAYQPLVTDDTGTQGAGGNQLEFAWVHDHSKDTATGDTTRVNTLPVVYTRGLTDNLDIAIGLPWSHTKTTGAASESGTGNPSVAMKWRIYEQENGWSIALKPEIVLPVSSSKETDGLGDHGTAYNATLIISRETSFGEFHINAGLGRYNDKNTPATDATSQHFSIAPAFKLSDDTLLAIDIGLDRENPQGGASDTSHYVLLGLVHSPNDDLDLAVGLQKTYSVAGSDNVWMATTGITWRFK
jgi:hypothetical protein